MARSGRHELTRRRSAAGRVLMTLAVLLALIALPAAAAAGVTLARGSWTTGVVGSPRAAGWIEAADTGLAIRRVPQSDQGPHTASEESLVAAVISDLQTFWKHAIPQITSASFTPLRGGVTAVDSAARSGTAPCVSRPDQITGNAYYCPADDGIVYDSSALVPVLLSRYGPPGLVGAFAHEFGHAIQARIGPTSEQRTAHPQRYPSLLIEAQGDCDAGAFLAWVVDGRAPHLHFGRSAMAAAVGPLLDFADPVTVSRTDKTAHGLGLDRLTSVLLGYRQGPAACHAMTMDSLHPTLGAVPLPLGGLSALDEPRYASSDAVLAAARGAIANLTGARVTAPVDPDDLAAAAPYGQFAQATVLALAVGRSLGPDGVARLGREPGTGAASASTGPAPSTGPGEADHSRSTVAACFAGAWVASVFGHAAAGELGSWPGDADEGLAAVRAQPQSDFLDAAAYADGFHLGLAGCR